MLKFKLKGFTLIECLVALALLGVASLSMVQIYANVCAVNRSNHDVNTSLMYQMQFVERYSGTNVISGDEQVVIFASGDGNDLDGVYGNPTDTKNSFDKAETDPNYIKHVKITKLDDAGDPIDDDSYYFPTDVHILVSREFVSSSDLDGAGQTSSGNYELRYKYVVGNTNT